MPTVRVGDLQINFERAGTGPSVVFLHGHGASLKYFSDLANHLKEEYTVLRYDQRGFGLTDKPTQPPYSTELWADDLYRFLLALGIQEAIVVGHSKAGRTCATFAANHPQMSRGLITLNTTWFGSNPKGADELERNAANIEEGGMRLALDQPWMMTIPDNSQHVRDLMTREILQNDPVCYALGSRAIADDFRGGTRNDIMKAIECPTLILIGDRDSAPLEGAIRMYRGVRNSRLAVLPNSGHFSILDSPELSRTIITDFLKAVTPV